MNRSDIAVHIEGLTRRFADLIAIDQLSLDVQPGELFGIVGPDGAGKTTLLRMLAGVLRPSGGDAVVHGHSIVSDPEGVKAHIGYMSQRFGLYTDLTVHENLMFYADLYQVPHDERKRRLDRLFQFSNLAPFQDRLAGHLSGGMKQKLGLSCALIHEPDILLLDEPTFGVDPISRRDLWLIIHEMVAHGVTVLVSTSYMDEAERFDRLALLHEGRLLNLDTPDALRHGLSGVLLAVKVDDVRRARDLLQQAPQAYDATVFGDQLRVQIASKTEQQDVSKILTRAGCIVNRMEVVLPSMEDVVIAHIAQAEKA